MGRKADRCAQALVHIRLAVQAMEDCPELPDVKDELRAIWIRLRSEGRADVEADRAAG